MRGSYYRVCNFGIPPPQEVIERCKAGYKHYKSYLGLMAFLAGLDKFPNLLTNWEQYVSPLAQRMVPLTPTSMMHVVGVIEMVVGLMILTKATPLCAYVVSAWLVCISLALLTTGRGAGKRSAGATRGNRVSFHRRGRKGCKETSAADFADDRRSGKSEPQKSNQQSALSQNKRRCSSQRFFKFSPLTPLPPCFRGFAFSLCFSPRLRASVVRF